MTKRCLLILLVLIFANYNAISQTDTIKPVFNVVYIEGLGTGGYGSVNYERQLPIFTKSRSGISRLGIRIGISTYNIKDYTTKFNPDIILPITISVVYGKKHKAELGFGQTITSIVENNFIKQETGRATNIHAHFTVGYRYQKNSSGFVFRCFYSPLIEFYKYYRHWGGVSVGYAF